MQESDLDPPLREEYPDQRPHDQSRKVQLHQAYNALISTMGPGVADHLVLEQLVALVSDIDRESHLYGIEAYSSSHLLETVARVQVVREILTPVDDKIASGMLGSMCRAVLFNSVQVGTINFQYRDHILKQLGMSRCPFWLLLWFAGNPEILLAAVSSLSRYQWLDQHDGLSCESLRNENQQSHDDQGNGLLHYLALNVSVARGVWDILYDAMSRYPSLASHINHQGLTFLHVYAARILSSSVFDVECVRGWNRVFGSELADIADMPDRHGKTALSVLLESVVEAQKSEKTVYPAIVGMIQQTKTFDFPRTRLAIIAKIRSYEPLSPVTGLPNHELQKCKEVFSWFLSALDAIDVLNRGLSLYKRAVASNITETRISRHVLSKTFGLLANTGPIDEDLCVSLRDTVRCSNGLVFYNTTFNSSMVSPCYEIEDPRCVDQQVFLKAELFFPREALTVVVDILKLTYFSQLNSYRWDQNIYTNEHYSQVQKLAAEAMDQFEFSDAMDIFQQAVWVRHKANPEWLRSPMFLEIIPQPGHINTGFTPDAFVSLMRQPQSRFFTIDVTLTLKKIQRVPREVTVPRPEDGSMTFEAGSQSSEDSSTTTFSLKSTPPPTEEECEHTTRVTDHGDAIANAINATSVGCFVIPANLTRAEYASHGVRVCTTNSLLDHLSTGF